MPRKNEWIHNFFLISKSLEKLFSLSKITSYIHLYRLAQLHFDGCILFHPLSTLLPIGTARWNAECSQIHLQLNGFKVDSFAAPVQSRNNGKNRNLKNLESPAGYTEPFLNFRAAGLHRCFASGSVHMQGVANRWQLFSYCPWNWAPCMAWALRPIRHRHYPSACT